MAKTPFITLTTDYGLKDPWVATVKGALYTALKETRIVDISHEISPFHIEEAAYIIKNAYQAFPKGTIHIIGIDSERTPENQHIAMKLDGHFFICANNGILSLIAKDIKPEKCVQIDIHDQVSSSFPVLDIFVQVAAHLARGGELDIIGREVKEIKTLTSLVPVIAKDGNKILGDIIYVDNYGNAISNISQEIFIEVGKGREFEILARGFKFNRIVNNYHEVIDFSLPKNQRDPAKRLALFNTSKLLEIAIYKSNPQTIGSASTLLGLNPQDNITVNFKSLN